MHISVDPVSRLPPVISQSSTYPFAQRYLWAETGNPDDGAESILVGVSLLCAGLWLYDLTLLQILWHHHS